MNKVVKAYYVLILCLLGLSLLVAPATPSIGVKLPINFGGYKNLVGSAFLAVGVAVFIFVKPKND